MGAAWGALGIVLAWRVGRAMVSVPFGLAFAAGVAFSPLQVTWSRLGGLPVAAVAHTLLVVWVAYAAGRRRSLWLGAVFGALCFTSLYHYYAARLAIPVAVVAIANGVGRRREREMRPVGRWLVLPAAALVFAACFTAVLHGSPDGAVRALWPRYTGYVGTAGEQTSHDVLRGAHDNARRQFTPTLRRYFWESRDAAPRVAAPDINVTGAAAPTAGALHGGLALLPLILLGGLGLLYSLLHPVRGHFWIALTLGGLLLPLLSVPSARRYLIFDLGWCALAAFGATWLWASAPVRALGLRWRRGVASATLVLLAAWSGLTVGLLNATLPSAPGTPIPFGESGIRDGWTCLACVDAGRRWATSIHDDAFVILFDADFERENPTSPAGLRLYGRIAALEARRPTAFVEFYSVLQNINRTDDPPRVPPYYDRRQTDAATYLQQRALHAAADRIVWEFRHPTAWERALAERLQTVGGERRTLDGPPLLSPLSSRRPENVAKPFQIWTSNAEIAAAFATLDSFLDPAPGWGSCLRLRPVGSREIEHHALTVVGAIDETNPGDPNLWAVGSYRFGWFGARRLPVWEPVAMALSHTLAGDQIRVLDRFAHESTFVAGAEGGRRPIVEFGTDLGRGCAAFAGQRWWGVDALRGTLGSSPPSSFAVPEGLWFGVARNGDVLAIASGAQEIVLMDSLTGTVSNRFPARVSPAFPSRLGDCSSIALGEGWVASLDPFAGRVGIYSLAGEPMADLDISGGTPIEWVATPAIAASGHHVGIARGNKLELIEVVDPCAGRPTS